MTREPREFDVVLWGATGYTGRLVAEVLLARHGVGRELRWAIGGRNADRLEAVRADLGAAASGLPIVLGDAQDAASVARLAERTRVVCTTVGPYARYGTPLVEACVKAGTDYCDLTGEIHWMQQMIDRFGDDARRTGARIVHACGFDCIPSDVGTWFVQREMRTRYGVASPHVKLRVQGFSGGASGGTIASMLEMFDAASRDPSVRRAMREPYAINPKDQRTGPDGPEQLRPHHDPDFGEWVAPFVMAGVDTKVVRRSNALLGGLYGRDFRYDEGVLAGRGPLGALRAAGLAAGLGGGMLLAAIGPLRRAVARRLPAPGEGPSPEARAAGYFDLRLFARHPQARERGLHARVTGDRDPGYGSTARMLAEAAVCLARDDLPETGGFWTPAALMGAPLVERLTRNAGLGFEIL